jgi:hypothetical protein
VHGPSLASAETTGLRTQVVISCLAILLICASAQALLFKWLSLPKRLVSIAVICASIGVAVQSAYFMFTVTAVPQAVELALIERRLEQTSLPSGGTILLIGVPSGTSLTNRDCDNFALFGCASSSLQWALPNMVRLWMREHHIDDKRYRLLFAQTPDAPTVVSFEPDWTTYVPRPTNAFVLDLGRDVLDMAASNRGS